MDKQIGKGIGNIGKVGKGVVKVRFDDFFFQFLCDSFITTFMKVSHRMRL
jgi:hypothetical protein